MHDPYSHAVARTAAAQVAEATGFDAMQQTAVDALGDVLLRYVQEMCLLSHKNAELAGRTDTNVYDLVAAFDELGIDLSDIQQCLKREEVPFPFDVPAYPTPAGPPLPVTFAAKNEQPPSTVPSFLPAFPDPHTMGSTAVYTGHETDPAAAQHVFTQAKKQGEEALVKLHARISAVLEAKDTQKQQGKQQGKQQEKQQEKQDEMAQGVGGSGGGVEGNGVVHASADEGVQAEGQDGGGAAAAVGTSMHGEKQGGADVADADMLVDPLNPFLAPAEEGTSDDDATAAGGGGPRHSERALLGTEQHTRGTATQQEADGGGAGGKNEGGAVPGPGSVAQETIGSILQPGAHATEPGATWVGWRQELKGDPLQPKARMDWDWAATLRQRAALIKPTKPALDAFEAAHDDALRGGGILRDSSKRKRKPTRGAMGAAEEGVEANAVWAKKVLEQADGPGGGMVGGMDDLERAVADADTVERM